MVRIPDLALRTTALMWLAVPLLTNPVLAQERLVFRVSAENTQYTQQHTIDVGDVSGHQVRVFDGFNRISSAVPARLIATILTISLFDTRS
jgi:hypothetical protein